MARFYLITGCSSGGKSTLLGALADARYRTVPEPGRRIVAEEEAGDGAALPWVDGVAFARRAAAMAKADLERAGDAPGPVFFDRGLLDAASGLEDLAGVPLEETMGPVRLYDDPVILAPPWPEIFVNDPARRHAMEAAVAEYDRLVAACARLGYRTVVLPKAPVAERVAFVRRVCAL